MVADQPQPQPAGGSAALRWSAKVRLPEHVLMEQLDGESVYLNLESETYVGLDEIATRMLRTLTASRSIDEAYQALLGDWDVDPQRLRDDLEKLLHDLLEQGLIQITG